MTKLRILLVVTLHLSLPAVGLFSQVERGGVIDLQPHKTLPADVQDLRRARQLEALGRYEQAYEIYSRRFFATPKSREHLEGALRCLKRLRDETRMLDFLQAALQVLPGNYRLLSELAAVRYRQGAKEEATRIWRGVVEEGQRDPQVYRTVAASMLENGLRKEAAELYLEARRRFRNPGLFTFELANLYVMDREFAKATREYANYVRANPGSYSFVESSLGAWLREPGAGEAIVAALREAVKQGPESPGLRAVLGGILLRMEQYEEALEEFARAEELLQQGQKKTPYGQLLVRLAEAASRSNELEVAERAYRAILEADPRSPYAMRARLGLASVLAKRGDVGGACHAYLDVAEKFPGSARAPEALYRAASLLHTQGTAPDSVLRLVDELVKRYPRSRWAMEAGLLVADLYATGEDYVKADETLKKVEMEAGEKWPPVRERARFERALLAFYRAEWDSALALLEDLTRPRRADKGEGQYANDAIELMLLIQAGRMADPEGLAAIAAARRLFEFGNGDSALTILANRLDDEPVSPLADRIWFELGTMADSLGRVDLAADAFRKVVEEFPKSLLADAAQWHLGLCLLKSGNVEAARAALEMLLTNYPKSVYLEPARRQLRALERKG